LYLKVECRNLFLPVRSAVGSFGAQNLQKTLQ